jgi:hypothetical protein
VEVLACLVRYHRKRAPSIKHAEFAALSEPDRELVRRLCGLMRVADGLDRSHAQNVQSVRVRFGAEGALIEVHSRSDASADVEASRDKAGVLKAVMGTRLRIEAAEGEHGANEGLPDGRDGEGGLGGTGPGGWANRGAARQAAATVPAPRDGAGLDGSGHSGVPGETNGQARPFGPAHG